LKTSIARGYFPALTETAVYLVFKPQCAVGLVRVVSVASSRSASFRSVGESWTEGRVFGSVIDVQPYHALD
jgi:hypothetical protein